MKPTIDMLPIKIEIIFDNGCICAHNIGFHKETFSAVNPQSSQRMMIIDALRNCFNDMLKTYQEEYKDLWLRNTDDGFYELLATSLADRERKEKWTEEDS